MPNILMPALSPTMEEGKLSKWLVKVGDTVKPGDVLAEIETDKATMEVESVDTGIVKQIIVPEGTEGVKVNAPIALILGEGEKEGDGEQQVAQAKPEPVPASARTETPTAPIPHVPPVAQDAPEKLPGPLFARVVEELASAALFNNRSFVHEDHLIGDLTGESHLMGDDQHGHATYTGQLAHDVEHLVDHLRIEC